MSRILLAAAATLLCAGAANAQTVLYPSQHDHPFAVNGGLVAIGNNNHVALGSSGPGTTADVDDDANTTDSSVADLVLPTGARVVHATLYWMQGGVSSWGTNPATVYPITATASDTTAIFAVPGAGSSAIVAEYSSVQNIELGGGITADQRAAHADVTDLVAPAVSGGGTFTFGVGNIAALNSDNSWALIVVYEEDNAPLRAVRFWRTSNWLRGTSGQPSSTVTLSDIRTPASDVTGDVLLIGSQGQSNYNQGENVQLNSMNLTDAQNPLNAVFNHSNSTRGVENPGLNPAPDVGISGVDLDVFSIDGVAPPDATSIDVTMLSTADEYFFLQLAGLAIDVQAPDFDVRKTAAPVGSVHPVPAGRLSYTITVTNEANDTAENVVLTDVLDANTTLIPGTFTVDSVVIGEADDDGDTGEFDANTGTWTVRLGTGAGASNGGTMTVGQTHTITFDVQIVAEPTAPEIVNQAVLAYTGELIGPQTVFTRTSSQSDVPGAPTVTPIPTLIGCSDSSREGFVDAGTYPAIASCGGAWTVPGVFHDAPECDRLSGNDGSNAAGTGCNVEDLCAPGWHVCYGPDDIASRTNEAGCVDAVTSDYPNNGSGTVSAVVPPGGAFFMTRTSGAGGGACDEVVNGSPANFNDLFGCGNFGRQPLSSCSPLNRFSGNNCRGLEDFEFSGNPNDVAATDYGYTNTEWAWSCSGNTVESLNVVKTRPQDQGGVLCCKDTDASLPEICDGVDNNGNGRIDETDFDGDEDDDEMAGDPCIDDSGNAGVISCAGDGSFVCLPPAPQACCMPDGSCADVIAATCTAQGGTPGGFESNCETATCVATLSSVTGRVWHDINRDSVDDPTESGIAGVTVFLDDDAGTNITSQVVDGTGVYAFGDLTAATYMIRVESDDAALLAGGFQAGTVENDADPNPTTIMLMAGEDITDIDFAFVDGCQLGTADATPCDDQDACTGVDACMSGVCMGGAGVECPAGDQCNLVSTCDPMTGACSERVPVADDTPCQDLDLCTQRDVCVSGVCEGQQPVVCVSQGQCRGVGQCNSETGQCSDPAGDEGGSCDDGDLCTQNDTCGEGTCAGTAIVCEAPSTCMAGGICNPQSGVCVPVPVENGLTCDDGNACTQVDSCLAGSCVGGDPVVCQPQTSCERFGVCDPEDGACSPRYRPQGVNCNDGSLCTTGDVCNGQGGCAGRVQACPEPGECQLAGTCNDATGLCSYPQAPGDDPVQPGLISLGSLGGEAGLALAMSVIAGEDESPVVVVVGWSNRADGSRGAFGWSEQSGMQEIPTNADVATAMDVDGGQAVGVMTTEGTVEVFRFDGVTVSALWGVSADGRARINATRMVAADFDEVDASGVRVRMLDTTTTDIPLPSGGTDARLVALSNGGHVVGMYLTDNDAEHGFLWTQADGTTDLGIGQVADVAADGTVVGTIGSGDDATAYVRAPDGTVTMLDAGTQATAISETGGVVVGSHLTDLGNRHAFRYTTADGLADLGAVGGDSVATAVSDDGAFIAGEAATGSGAVRAFLWSAERGFENAGTLSGDADVRFVNDAGRMIGGAGQAFISDMLTTACFTCDEDVAPPEITCPSFQATVECQGDGTAVALGEPSVFDACGQPVEVTSNARPVYPEGQTNVVFTATDTEGNAASCTTLVTVEDTMPPQIACPPTVTVTATDEICGASLELPVTATDQCNGADGLTFVQGGGDVFPIGTTTVAVTALDRAGNAASCMVDVTVVDSTEFTLTCDESLTVSAPPNLCGYSDPISGSLGSQCGPRLNVTVQDTLYPIGDSEVVFTGEGRDEEVLTCVTALTVEDITRPRVQCNAPTTLAGEALPVVLQPTASDACTATLAISDLGCVGADDAALTAEDCGLSLDAESNTVAIRLTERGAATASFTVTATDPSGNETAQDCVIDLGEPPGPTGVDISGLSATGGGGCAGAPSGTGLVFWLMAGLGLLAVVRRRRAVVTQR